MKFQDIKEDGRIVKGVNTTVDVDTNQIPKEAGKFGNKVDKDGVPPTLSKKVKGKSTNVLFNLGLSEGKYADIHDVKDYNPDNLEIWVKGVGVYTLNGLKNRLKQRLEGFKDNMDYNAEGVESVLSGTGYDAFMSMLRGYNEVMKALETPQMKRKKTIAKRKAQYSEGEVIPNPKNTFLAKSDTAYDHYKIGTNLANLKDVPKGANYDEPDVVIAPYAGQKEMKYLMKQLNRIGYDVQDAQGYKDAHFDDEPTGGEAPPQIKDQGKLGKIKLNKLRSVQKGRNFRKLEKQMGRVKDGTYSPLTIDPRGRIVNGHHRFDALRLMGEEFATVRMLDTTLEEMLSESNIIVKEDCPPATQDLELNTKNRDATLKNFNYGPLNVDEPGDYWEKIAKYWKTDVKAAKASNCGNCVAFDISPRMDDCMPGETSDEFGRLGYCWMHHFKCHSARSCHTWAKGGPIVDDEKSLDWQKRGEDKVKENFADGKKKGKSRPGRVKKSGASCNGSVTALRKKAKKASGERARMYHWCANMKGGKKK